MPFGGSLENKIMPSPEKPEANIEKERVAKEKMEPTEEIKTSEKKERTEVQDNLKLEQIEQVPNKEVLRGEVKMKDLVENGDVYLNVDDLDYQAARDLVTYLLKNPNIKSIDCEGIFARTGFEQDELIDLLKSRDIILKNYKGVAKYFLEADIEVDFYVEGRK